MESAGPVRSDREDATPQRALPQEPECPPGWTTGPPDFVGIGAQRCGTTWWFGGALQAHPGVAVAPGGRKEFHFFDRYWTQDVETDFAARYARFFPRPEGSITGEWTPSYMCEPWTVPLLAEAAPRARFLILLRDPVERYRSGIAPLARQARDRGYDPYHVVFAYHAILHSLYYAQVKRTLEILGRDSVLVLQYERCVDDPLGQMRRTQQFLGLEPMAAAPDALKDRVSPDIFPLGDKPPLPARLRSELTSALADDVRQVGELCPELDLGLWPNFADL